MRQYVQEEHIHPSPLGRTLTVNSWQSVPLGRPFRVPQRGYLTMQIRDTATLNIAIRISTIMRLCDITTLG